MGILPKFLDLLVAMATLFVKFRNIFSKAIREIKLKLCLPFASTVLSSPLLFI